MLNFGARGRSRGHRHSLWLAAIALLTLFSGVIVPASYPKPVSAAQTTTIVSPLTDQTVSGPALLVSASADGAASAAYAIDGAPGGSLSFDATTGLWNAAIDLAAVPAGARNVTVTGNFSGASSTDTAWRVSFPNALTSPRAIASSTSTTRQAPSITIGLPLSNQAYSGTITVLAHATGAASVAYAVDAGAPSSMAFDASSGMWQGNLNTTSLTNGTHNVDVIDVGLNGTTVTDRAWSVSIQNLASATSTAPTSVPSSTPPPSSAQPSIAIGNPRSNQSYSGTINVQAMVGSASSVAYTVDGGAGVAMSRNSGSVVWQANLDTSGLRNGTHTVDVINTGGNGTTVKDRAWNVGTNNTVLAATATPVPAATSTAAAATPTATMTSTATPTAAATATATATATAVPTVARTARAWGVNYAGAEFRPSVVGTIGTDYVYPADSSRDSYFASKGLRLARLPITWERLQREAYAPLSANDVAGIRSVLDTSAAAGQKVIIDLHNYGRYYGSPLTVADAPKLANFWQQLAAALRGHPGLYGYELMNEPHDLPDGGVGWAAIAQSATNGVRQSDTSAWVLVPGYSWQTATFWASNNPTLAVQDSANHLQYAAHLYFDSDSTGFYAKSYDADGASPTVGVDRVQPFLAWLASHNATGMLTEYGIPSTDSRWLTVLDGFLNAISSNPNITGGTYWAAGPWWGSYPLSVEPTNGVDKPQMSVLTRYRSQ